MSFLKNSLIFLAAGAFFALLYAAGILGPLEERVYDLFFRVRPKRERIDNVVFLDVDDAAVAYNGVFPWPRSIMADGFLRLKEYGAAAAILDIEFIDKGPQGIDAIYYSRDFPADFEKAFSDIGTNALDLFEALNTGRINRDEASLYAGEFLDLIQDEKIELFRKTSGIARDNDVYLSQAAALFDRAWATLNLQTGPLEGEQASRRPLAERKFSRLVDAAPGAHGGDYEDILPAIPSFSEAARGAGFTNVFIDKDGVRRRIHLAQKVQGYWYLQLAFAPLMEYLGNPEIRLEKQRLILKNARLPGGDVKEITIPLDTGGKMMLDWPETKYENSFSHLSFEGFSRLEEFEAQAQQYLDALEGAGIGFFAQFDETLSGVPGAVYRINELFAGSREARSLAIAEKSDEAFDRFLELRNQGNERIRSLADLDIGAKVNAVAESVGEEYPEEAAAILEEAEYIATVAGYLDTVSRQYEEAQASLRKAIAGKFCIIGRSDTGTTDIGVNPFYGEYVNVGTHAVVLDTILSESFITPLHWLWSAALCFILGGLIFLAFGGFKPGPRTALGAGAVILFVAGCLAAFRFFGIFIGPLGPVISAIIVIFVREIVSYLVSEKEKQFINKALSTYVSKEVVNELIANPSLLQLGGAKRQMSAVFTDIQSFSTISEQLDPEGLVLLLNRYLTVMSDIIMENTGTIDKYEGDAIIAFFGAPVFQERHAALACRSALRMKKAEVELNRAIMEDHLSPSALYTRIGINTGEMVVGNMGTSSKMNYTIMGNAVNIAARLEGVNKQYHTGGILISEYTRQEIGDEFVCRSLDRVRVVGINTPLRLYELLGERSGAGIAEAGGFAGSAPWEDAIASFEKKEFQAAAEIFDSIASRDERDNVARLYLERCRDYIRTPPPDDWDGINNLTSK
ncbi:MAG: CHASE2 domain-containing protein [Spirochaetaceae bacterium]|nr:CHASE2 domain-containing protein [Spirochaetaceae bacterium]